MPASRVKIDERLDLIIKGALFEGYNLCHLAREKGDTTPLEDGEFANSLTSLGKNPKEFVKEIREKYDPLYRGKKTSSGRGSGRSSNDPELADVPYDPSLCCKRVWNGGLGAQCQSAKVDGCEFCTRCTKEFGNKGALPFGYYNEGKPEFDLVTNKSLPWRQPGDTTEPKKPKMKVSDIREKLEELGLDTSGKKAELLERLNAANLQEPASPKPASPKPASPKPASPKPASKPVKELKKKATKKVFKKNTSKMLDPISARNAPVLELCNGPPQGDDGIGVGLNIKDNSIELEEPVAEEEKQEEEKQEEVVVVEEEVVVVEEAVAVVKEVVVEEVVVEEAVVEEAVEEEEEEEEEEEDQEEEGGELDTDDFTEIEYEDHDYLINEDDNKVYTMDGVHIGAWDDDDGIIWTDTDEARTIKEHNGHE